MKVFRLLMFSMLVLLCETRVACVYARDANCT